MSFANDVVDLMGFFSVSFCVIVAGQTAYGFTKNPRMPGLFAEIGILAKQFLAKKVK